MIALEYHQHDRRWLWDNLEPWPPHMIQALAAQYSGTFRRKGRAAANTEIRETNEEITPAKLRLATDEDAIRAAAQRRARECSGIVARRGVQLALPILQSIAAQQRIEFPDEKKTTEQGRALRLADPLWWRRQLRKSNGRAVENTSRRLGLTNKKEGIYVSNDTLQRHQQQRSRNADMLKAFQAINELGQSFTLAELAELSVSNPAIRRAELMTRIAGFEAYADGAEHVAIFYTVTCPARFHSHSQAGVKYRRHDGSSPRAAAQYLQGLWTRVRAAWARAEIAPYGFRVAEPHHDGTPHWHLLLFMPKGQVAEAGAILKAHALKDSPNERGAKKYRYKAKQIDRSDGRSAVGYIAKYIAKSIDGFGLESDLYGTDSKAAAARVAAWASTWGIRQFQQIGGPPVGLWRELRRVKESPGEILEELRSAADAGNWCAYVDRMGGAGAATTTRPAGVYRVGAVELDNGEIRLNKYQEPAADQVRGVQDVIGNCQITRLHEWRIERAPKAVDPLLILSEGEAAAPWTRVNNCTGVDQLVIRETRTGKPRRGGVLRGLDQLVNRETQKGWRPSKNFRFAGGMTWGEFEELEKQREVLYESWKPYLEKFWKEMRDKRDARAAEAAKRGRNDGGGGEWYPGIPSASGSRAAGQSGAGSR